MLKSTFIIVAFILVTACNTSKKEAATRLGITYNQNDSGKQVAKAEKTPTQVSTEKQDSLAESKERGGLLYNNFCIQCHQTNGKGVPNAFPPLADSNWLTDKREASIYAVKYGQRGEIKVNNKTYNGVMTPMGLNNQEIADVLNYVMNSWGNTQDKMVTAAEVAKVEK